MRHLGLLALFIFALSITGCMTAGQHKAAVRDDTGDRLTVGTVQREIKVGMSSAEVVEVLGAPNMVSTDAERREVWVYDKISTERAYSTSSGGVSALILGGAGVGDGVGGGGLGGSYSQGSGAASTSQRTLTIIIKYDEDSKVRDFAYRQSSF